MNLQLRTTTRAFDLVQHGLASATGGERDKLAAREAALIAAQRGAILGELARHEDITTTLRLGHFDAVSVAHPKLAPKEMAEALAAVFASPHARLLRTVAILPSEGELETVEGHPRSSSAANRRSSSTPCTLRVSADPKLRAKLAGPRREVTGETFADHQRYRYVVTQE